MKSRRSSFVPGLLFASAISCLGAVSGFAEGLDPMSATAQAVIAAEEPRKGQELTPQQEKNLALRQAVFDRTLEEVSASWKPYEKVLGSGRCRELDRALFHFNLQSPAYGHDLWHNPHAMDDLADTVLSAYAKLQREHLEDVIGLDEWLDRKRPETGSRRDRSETSYRMRVSPRLSSDYLGVKLRMPYSGLGLLDHLSFQARYDFEEGQSKYLLKFDDRVRYIHLSYEPDNRQRGKLLSLSLRFAW